MSRLSFAPGRVNLIGEHTDYTGGLAMPMAIGLGTTIRYTPEAGSRFVELVSSVEKEPARVDLALPASLTAIGRLSPSWARYVGGVVATLRPTEGGRGAVTSDVPIGAGLSSSASFELALALALGFGGDARSLARACQQAEHLAFGAPTGILDQMAGACAERGCAMQLDCHSLAVVQVPLPGDVEIAVVHSGLPRAVASTAYAERRSQCLAAEEVVGPLRLARLDDLSQLRDEVLARRARHVVTENERVRQFSDALLADDLSEAGRLMAESHASLRDDYEVSLPALDDLVGFLQETPGVYGARLTGAGFGGCAVALAAPGALAGALEGRTHWFVRPEDGARLLEEP